jgi:hypothetical protein
VPLAAVEQDLAKKKAEARAEREAEVFRLKTRTPQQHTIARPFRLATAQGHSVGGAPDQCLRNRAAGPFNERPICLLSKSRLAVQTERRRRNSIRERC